MTRNRRREDGLYMARNRGFTWSGMLASLEPEYPVDRDRFRAGSEMTGHGLPKCRVRCAYPSRTVMIRSDGDTASSDALDQGNGLDCASRLIHGERTVTDHRVVGEAGAGRCVVRLHAGKRGARQR